MTEERLEEREGRQSRNVRRKEGKDDDLSDFDAVARRRSAGNARKSWTVPRMEERLVGVQGRLVGGQGRLVEVQGRLVEGLCAPISPRPVEAAVSPTLASLGEGPPQVNRRCKNYYCSGSMGC